MTELFPILQPQEVPGQASALPVCREIGWDYENNRALFYRGEPVVVEGMEAVCTWAWLALHTPRFRHEIFSRAYGCELDGLIGRPYTEELKQAEARRYVSECLEINPYIKNVENVSVDFTGTSLSISCTLNTIYGGKELSAYV